MTATADTQVELYPGCTIFGMRAAPVARSGKVTPPAISDEAVNHAVNVWFGHNVSVAAGHNPHMRKAIEAALTFGVEE